MSGAGLPLGTIGPTAAASAATRAQQLQELIAKSATATTAAGESSFAAALQAASAAGGGPPEAPEPPPAPAAGPGETGGTAPPANAAYATPAYAPASTYSPSIASTPISAGGGGAGSGGAGAYAGMIERAALENGVEPALLMGLIEQESGFDPSARSDAGAVGLTQLMPSTAASLGVAEPLDPEQSIAGGARLLGQLLRQFDGNVSYALAAYNAGAGAVEQYGGIPPYPETEAYVSKVLANAQSFRGAS